MKPLIGITTGEIKNIVEPWSPITYGQSHTYSDAIIEAGGLPVLIPIMKDKEVLRQLYAKLDGILFAGGNDIDPTLYGQAPYPETKNLSQDRDNAEVLLMQWALADKKPILAICRGMQLLNVVQGGTLYQDIQTDITDAGDHTISTRKKTRVDLAHQLRVEPKSKLADILQSYIVAANTHHHQAINTVGDDLRVSTHAEDGIIEGIEGAGDNYIIGVQCHPESLGVVEPKWNRLFASFIDSSHKP